MDTAKITAKHLRALRGAPISVLLAYESAPQPPSLPELAALTGYSPKECLAGLEMAYALELLPGAILLAAGDPVTTRLLAPHLASGAAKWVPNLHGDNGGPDAPER